MPVIGSAALARGPVIDQVNDFNLAAAVQPYAHFLGTETSGTVSMSFTASEGGGLPAPAANLVTTTARQTSYAGHPDMTDCTVLVRCSVATGFFTGAAIHSPDGSPINGVRASITPGGFQLSKGILGTNTVMVQHSPAIVAGTQYWVELIAVGTTYSANVYADVAGAKGALIDAIPPTVIADAYTTGYLTLQGTGAGCTFGGPFANVCVITGPAPTGCTTNLNAANWAQEPCFCWSKVRVHSGVGALSILANSPSNAYWASPQVNLAVGRPYLFQGWVYLATVGTGGSGAYVCRSGNPVGNQIAATGSWQISKVLYTPLVTSQALALLLAHAAGPKSLVYFDDCTISDPSVGADLAAGIAPANQIVNSLSIAPPPTVRMSALSLAPVAFYRLDDAGGVDVVEETSNWDFELGTFAGWTTSGAAVIDPVAPLSGLYSAKIASGTYQYVYQTLTLPVGLHIVTVIVKTSADFAPSGVPGISIENGTGAGTNLGTPGITPAIVANMGATVVRKAFRVTTAGTFRILLTNTYGGTCVGSIWFDDLHVYRSLVRDSSGNGFDGSMWHTVVTGVAGIVPGDPASKAMTFDGSTAQIKMPNSVQAQITDDLTIAVWANVPTGVGKVFVSIFQGINWIMLYHSNGQMVFRTADGVTGLQELVSAGGAITYGVLHRLVATRRSSDGQKAIYVDGIQKAVNVGDRWTAPNGGGTSLQHGFIGSREQDSFLQGTVKDVEICNYAWTPGQVANDWLVGKFPLPAALAPSIAPAATVAASVAVLT